MPRLIISFILFLVLFHPAIVQANIRDGLVGWWKFNESSGNALDSSGNGYTGTLVSSPTRTDDCKKQKCLSFDGSNYVDMGNVLNLTSAITISVWLNASSWAGAWPMIVAKDVNVAYLLMQDDDMAGTKMGLRIGGAGSANTAEGATDLNTNQWYLVTGTYDGTTINLYINGVLDATKARAGTIPTSAASLQVAAGNTANKFVGRLDDVRIYNRALNAGEVADLYKADIQIHHASINNAKINN